MTIQQLKDSKEDSEGCPFCHCTLVEVDGEFEKFICPRCDRVRVDLMQALVASGKPFPKMED